MSERTDFIVGNFCSSITVRKCPYVLSDETDENIQLDVLEERFRQLSQPCFVPSVTMVLVDPILDRLSVGLD